MKRQMFEELLGKCPGGWGNSRRPQETFPPSGIPRFRHPVDSRADQSLSVGVCAFDRGKREDAPKLGAGPATPYGTGGSAAKHH
jgi:hypothetical protein